MWGMSRVSLSNLFAGFEGLRFGMAVLLFPQEPF